MNLKFLIITLLFLSFNGFCQQHKVDSLLKALPPKPDSVRVWKLLNIANIYLRTDSNQVKKYTSEALALSKKLGYGRGEIRSYAVYGELAYYFSNFDRAEYWFDLILKRAETLPRVADYKLASLNSKAILAYRRGELDKTAQYVSITIKEGKKALSDPKNDKLAFERVVYMGYNMMGAVCIDNANSHSRAVNNKKEFDRACYNYRQCLQLCLKYPSIQYNLPTVYHNIARCFRSTQHSLDSVLYYSEKEAAAAKALHLEIDLIGAYYNQAEVYFDKGQYKKAETILQNAQKLTEKYQDPDHLVLVPQLLSKLYVQTGRLKEALPLLQQAFVLASSKQMPDQARSINELMISVYEKQGDYKNAYLHLGQDVVLKDSIYNEAKNQAINGISTKYETEKKELQIAQLEADKTRRNYFIAALLVGLGLVVYSIWSKFKAIDLQREVLSKEAVIKQKEAEQMQTEIEAKNRELTLQGLYLDQRKNVLQDVKQLLSNNESKLLDKQVILKEIDATLQLENEWHTFRKDFEHNNPTFFSLLLQKTSNLTELELRHASYLKLGFGTKQVAQMLNISPDSVSISRVRLKKKIGLDTDTSLTDYLKSI